MWVRWVVSRGRPPDPYGHYDIVRDGETITHNQRRSRAIECQEHEEDYGRRYVYQQTAKNGPVPERITKVEVSPPKGFKFFHCEKVGSFTTSRQCNASPMGQNRAFCAIDASSSCDMPGSVAADTANGSFGKEGRAILTTGKGREFTGYALPGSTQGIMRLKRRNGFRDLCPEDFTKCWPGGIKTISQARVGFWLVRFRRRVLTHGERTVELTLCLFRPSVQTWRPRQSRRRKPDA